MFKRHNVCIISSEEHSSSNAEKLLHCHSEFRSFSYNDNVKWMQSMEWVANSYQRKHTLEVLLNYGMVHETVLNGAKDEHSSVCT